MDRQTTIEWLDELPAEDPRALRSRRDLRRLNSIMGHPALLARHLQQEFIRHLSLRVTDIGAGDGAFLLDVARRVRGRWRTVDATLVDRHQLVDDSAREEFHRLNWRTVRTIGCDVFDWLRDESSGTDALVSNLFLHHFSNAQLRELFRHAAAKARVFIALEPRRSPLSLFLGRCVGIVGCGSVTRHDAVASVRAGFAGRELTALWPDPEGWELVERKSGFCTHLFIARRIARRNVSSVFEPVISAVFDANSAATVQSPAQLPDQALPPDPAGTDQR